MFKRLNVLLLYLTAYHPQTDKAGKYTNQITKIALQFYLADLDDICD